MEVDSMEVIQAVAGIGVTVASLVVVVREARQMFQERRLLQHLEAAREARDHARRALDGDPQARLAYRLTLCALGREPSEEVLETFIRESAERWETEARQAERRLRELMH